MGIFGTQRSRPAQWLRTSMNQARRVGRLDITFEGAHKGSHSGFLLDGTLFGERYRELPLFLTNPAYGKPPFYPVGRSTVLFQGMFDDAETAAVTAHCVHGLASSAAEHLNYELLLLDRWPGEVPELVLSPRRVAAGDKVYVVSYPGGRGLEVSLEDNEALAADKARGQRSNEIGRREAHFYYRAPTEPGSGGGAVFNENWELVGVHAGWLEHGNFGVTIDEILADVRAALVSAAIPQELADRARDSRRAPRDAADSPDYFSAFVSYSHADSAFAHRLYNALQVNGVRAWLDVKELRPGDDIYDAVQRGIQHWDKVLLCCSQSSLTSWWVDSEIDRAFQKERDLFKDRGSKVIALVPLMLDSYLLEGWKSGKASEVKSRLAADFREWQDEREFETRVMQLLGALRADEGARAAPPPSKL